MNFNYIVVQSGGRGTRLMPFTRNKPKALVAVNNRPILFHLFERYPECKFLIVGDYLDDVLNNYLENFASVEYITIRAEGSGNAAGLKRALEFVPEGESFMIIWSDLILGEQFKPETLDSGNYVGVTSRFPCSWSFEDGVLAKTPLDGHGVAGCFLFESKSLLAELPSEGSLTKFLTRLELKPMNMLDTLEIGTVDALEQIDVKDNRCRPYNEIIIDGERVIKNGLTREAKVLLEREKDWYRKLSTLGFSGIPKIFSTEPLVMERINGTNIFRAELDESRKPVVLRKLIETLDRMHKLEPHPPNAFDMQKDYYLKTLSRLRSIASALPFASDPSITINGRDCLNPLRARESFRKMTSLVSSMPTEFGILHGDCTFTNTLIDAEENIYFIDARGYFGNTKLIGDVDYDWAKICYSIVGAFDQFNVKNFELDIRADAVEFSIRRSGWEHLEDYFFELIPNASRAKIKFVHSIIWLSLASHCWEDYDSMCLAFYNGTHLWNEASEELMQ